MIIHGGQERHLILTCNEFQEIERWSNQALATTAITGNNSNKLHIYLREGRISWYEDNS